MTGLDGRRIEIRGTVQGVGFRPWVVRLARELGVNGAVWNDAAGVLIEAFAAPPTLDHFLSELRAHPPPAAQLTDFQVRSIPGADVSGFDIRESGATEERRVTIPPDLPTCAECLAELRDPSNRRYRYPFTNCTCCGPRYTIVRGLPYDRPATTMARFAMCEACQREYDDVSDRRYHAQPNACPVCGPRLQALTREGRPVEGDPILLAASALRSGQIVALKGLGGFHLAVDATHAEAVRLLRARKRRDEKPFAVMVRDLEAARRVAQLSPADEALLGGIERPVVLVARREPSSIAAKVAPGLHRLGLMLPYTPLHHLLLDELDRPLVMTSGNLSEEPIAIHDDALARLGSLADLLVVHDREIEARADDSVAQVVSSKPMLLRRSRGYVSRGHRLARPVARPVLACGAHLKNTFCLATGDAAYLSAHVGDLENLETLTAFEEGVDRMERLLQIRPEVLAHDLHPEYLSTQYARRRTGVIAIPVQHHHAHVVSAMVQHGLQGKVLGLAWDGTGLGTDGTSWGSELLLAGAEGFERLATFRSLPLAGGERAIREVWRLTLVALDDAFDGAPPLDELELFREVPQEEVALVRQMVASGLNSPRAHGAGRYFDAMGALALGRRRARYEGQAAIALEQAADPTADRAYPFEIDLGVWPWSVDLRPAFREAVRDLLEGRSPGVVSARFHAALVAAASELLRLARDRFGKLPAVLTGGCFQNVRLSSGVVKAVSPDMAVFLHEDIPAGDGGLSIGQAVIADAVARTISQGSRSCVSEFQAGCSKSTG